MLFLSLCRLKFWISVIFNLSKELFNISCKAGQMTKKNSLIFVHISLLLLKDNFIGFRTKLTPFFFPTL